MESHYRLLSRWQYNLYFYKKIWQQNIEYIWTGSTVRLQSFNKQGRSELGWWQQEAQWGEFKERTERPNTRARWRRGFLGWLSVQVLCALTRSMLVLVRAALKTSLLTDTITLSKRRHGKWLKFRIFSNYIISVKKITGVNTFFSVPC